MFAETELSAKVKPSKPAESVPDNQKQESLPVNLISKPDNSLKKIAAFLQQDIGLRGEVIREANSVIYSLGRPVANLHQAIAFLGLNRCKEIIGERLKGTLELELEPQFLQARNQRDETLLRTRRLYRKRHLSSLFTSKNPLHGPHFVSSIFEQT